MTLDTVETTVDQSALNKYLNMLDERDEVYCFIISESTSERTVLELSRNGTADGVQLVLNVDGTWKMASCLVVGDSLNV